jgi:hypothetical protein
MNEVIITAMAAKARHLGLGVMADGIRDGVISVPAVAAFASLGLCSAEHAAAILAAGRVADGGAVQPWDLLLKLMTLDADAGGHTAA